MDVSRSGYYAYLEHRRRSPREDEEAMLVECGSRPFMPRDTGQLRQPPAGTRIWVT